MSEYMYLIGKIKRYYINGLQVDVIIKDVKKAWGRVDVKIIPVRGIGEKWVNIESLSTRNF